jgi:hypothetical protein
MRFLERKTHKFIAHNIEGKGDLLFAASLTKTHCAITKANVNPFSCAVVVNATAAGTFSGLTFACATA